MGLLTMSESYQNMEEGVPLVGEVVEDKQMSKSLLMKVAAGGMLLVLATVAAIANPMSSSVTTSVITPMAMNATPKEVFTPEERSEVSLFFSKNDKAVFDEIDTDHDKQISPKEFELVKSHPNDQARALAKSLKFEDMDINGNKFIEFDEFQTYLDASGNMDLHRFVRGDTEITTAMTSQH